MDYILSRTIVNYLFPCKTRNLAVMVSLAIKVSNAQLCAKGFANFLSIFCRTAARRETQQVALDSEILDTIPKLYINREEQITLELKCPGTSNKSCQGAALVTVQVRNLISHPLARRSPNF